MINITIAEETELELETEPDRNIEELVEEMGPAEELEDFYYGEEWQRYDILDNVSISLDDLRRDSSPIRLILFGAALTALGLFLVFRKAMINVRRFW